MSAIDKPAFVSIPNRAVLLADKSRYQCLRRLFDALARVASSCKLHVAFNDDLPDLVISGNGTLGTSRFRIDLSLGPSQWVSGCYQVSVESMVAVLALDHPDPQSVYSAVIVDFTPALLPRSLAGQHEPDPTVSSAALEKQNVDFESSNAECRILVSSRFLDPVVAREMSQPSTLMGGGSLEEIRAVNALGLFCASVSCIPTYLDNAEWTRTVGKSRLVAKFGGDKCREKVEILLFAGTAGELSSHVLSQLYRVSDAVPIVSPA